MERTGGKEHFRLGQILVKRVLMIAYHFPPMNVSSGIQRTLRFSQYLPELGWDPIVLTVHPRVYPSVSQASLAELPPKLHLCRAFALDTAKHLSLPGGKYPRLLSIPDRWWTWWLGAVPAGLLLIRKLKPDVLWSTYPVATAHLIGYTLHRLTGIPWIADFRDPMAQEDYPSHPLDRRVFRWIEYQTLKHCNLATFTAPGALQLYSNRYPSLPESRLKIIENGYDEDAFSDAEQSVIRQRTAKSPLTIVHSGTIYPSERDPRAFFGALSQLLANGQVERGSFRVVLRATGSDEFLRGLLSSFKIEDIVVLASAISYREALAEMLAADGLLILQAANCNFQVPAKVYEYLRARRPILALTDPAGDTASVLRDAGIDTVAPLDSEKDIATLLVRFLALMRDARAPVALDDKVEAASRKARTAELAKVLNAVSK